MNLLSTITFIAKHPLNRDNKLKAIIRFVKWQINTRLNPYPVIYPLTSKSKLLIAKGMTGATGNLYCGLHELNDMAFLLHFLRAEDLFVDIGANIGSYTILASSHIGAKTISIEPVPATFSHLLNNIYINNISLKVIPMNYALGSKKGIIKFTKTLDTENHVATDNDLNTIDVQLEILDNILEGENPKLIKIDVEGFETEVIKGASKSLNNKALKAVIIELNGSGVRYNYNEQEIHNILVLQKFEPYIYEPFKRELTKAKSFGEHNTIYIRDLPFVEDRIRTAKKVEVQNNVI